MKKVLSILLVCLLLVGMFPLSSFADSGSLYMCGRLKNGASKSYSFTLDSASDLTINYINVDTPIDSGDNGLMIKLTRGNGLDKIYDSKGNMVFRTPKNHPWGADYTEMRPSTYTVSLPAGSYTYVVKEADYYQEESHKIYDYFIDVTWEDSPKEEPANPPASEDNDKPSSGDTTTKPSTTPTTKPSTNSGTANNESQSSDSNATDSSASDEDENTNVDTDTNNNENESIVKANSSTFTVNNLKKAVDENKEVVFEDLLGKATLDTTALKTIINAANDAKDIEFIFAQVRVVDLNEEQRQALKDVDVAMFISADIIADGKVISKDFGGGCVTVEIPFTAPEGTSAEEYSLVYVSDDGTLEVIPTNYSNGVLVAKLQHFSEYGIIKTSTIPSEKTSINSNPNKDQFPLAVTVSIAVICIAVIAGGIFVYRKKHQ